MKILLLADDDNACQGLLTNLVQSLSDYENQLHVALVCEPGEQLSAVLEKLHRPEKLTTYTLNQSYCGEVDLTEVRLWAQSLIKDLQPDVAHVLSPLFVLQKADCPLVYTVHPGMPPLWDYVEANKPYDPTFTNYQAGLGEMLAASSVTATTLALAEAAKRHWPQLEHVNVIYPGVEESFEHEQMMPGDRILITVADHYQEAVAAELMEELVKAGRRVDLLSPLQKAVANVGQNWGRLMNHYDTYISLDGDEMRVLQACMSGRSVFAVNTPALQEMWPIHLHNIKNDAQSIACKLLGCNDEELARQRLLARMHAGRYTLQRMGTGYMHQYNHVLQTARMGSQAALPQRRPHDTGKKERFAAA